MSIKELQAQLKDTGGNGFSEGIKIITVEKINPVETDYEDSLGIEIEYRIGDSDFKNNQRLYVRYNRTDDNKLDGTISRLISFLSALDIDVLDMDLKWILPEIDDYNKLKDKKQILAYIFKSAKPGSDKLYWGFHHNFLPVDAGEAQRNRLIKDFASYKAWAQQKGILIYNLEPTVSMATTSLIDDEPPF